MVVVYHQVAWVSTKKAHQEREAFQAVVLLVRPLLVVQLVVVVVDHPVEVTVHPMEVADHEGEVVA